MSDAAILALLDERIREAEESFLNSDLVKRFKAHNEHIWMEHGSAEICTCPGWDDVRANFTQAIEQ
jgi:hypothetical protein